MRLAGVVQRRMIPQRAPLIPGLDIAAAYVPCFDVGGDFYDFFKVSDSRIVIQIADVSGKGIPAAIMMSCFKGAVSAYADAAGSFRPAVEAYARAKGRAAVMSRIIEKLNTMACSECTNGEFITLFYAAIDVEEHAMTYCNCGHEPAILIRAGQTEDLDKGGLVLGVSREADYEIDTIRLEDGDCLLFYTDGLIDAANFEGQLWGRENLLEAAKKFTAGSAEQMVRNVLRYRRRFVGLARQIDDTSIIVVKIDRTAEPEFMKRVSY